MAGERGGAATGIFGRRLKKRWIAAAVLAVWIAGIWFVPRFPIGPFTLYGNMTDVERAARIPYSTLSSEATHPFKTRVYKHAGYDRAAARFPDARSCLVKSERGQADPDIRLMDWYMIGDFGYPWEVATVAAEVCLFRLFAGMPPESVAAWLEFQGFGIGNLDFSVRQETGNQIGVDACKRAEKASPIARSVILAWISKIYYSECIHPRWDREQQLVSTGYSRNSL